MADQVTGYVLDPDVVFADVPVHFANFPGVWTPGEAIAMSELLDRMPDVDNEDDLATFVAEQGFPLRKVTVKAGEGSMPRAVTQIASEEEVRRGDQPMPDAPLPAGELLPDGTISAELAAGSGQETVAEPAGPADMTVAELDDTYGTLEGYPADKNRAAKVKFVGDQLAQQAAAEGAVT